MISTINISLPQQLKMLAEQEIKLGNYVSFSDFVRTAIRDALNKAKYDRWTAEAKRDYKSGKGLVLNNEQDIENFVKSL